MTFSKKSFFIIGCVGLLVLIYFFLRGTTLQDIVKVYKHTPVSKRTEVKGVTDVSSDTSTSAKSAKYVHQKSIGEMQHPHSHPHEAPSATFIVSLRERVDENSSQAMHRLLAYVESEDGQAFFDSLPHPDEIFEKMKSFGAFKNTPERQAYTDRLYRQHFPTGTVDDHEPFIRERIREVVLEYELHKAEKLRTWENIDVLVAFSTEDKVQAWLEKKFGPDPRPLQKWVFSTFEDIRLAEQEKSFASENPHLPQLNRDLPRREPLTPQTVLPSEDEQTPQESGKNTKMPLDVQDVPRNTPDALQQLPETSTLIPTTTTQAELEKQFQTQLRKSYTPDRIKRAMTTLNRYGPEEGLRRLKASDKEVAEHIERMIRQNKEND